MIIGEAAAVGELWNAAQDVLPAARQDRPGQPVYAITEPPPPGESGLRAAGQPTSTCSSRRAPPPTRSSSASTRWRAATTASAGARRPRSTRAARGLWIEDGVVLFKAEASAWTPSAVQLQQVWVDPAARGRGHASRGLRDLSGCCSSDTPTVTLFVRRENEPAIRLYETIGMRHVLDYRSVLLLGRRRWNTVSSGRAAPSASSSTSAGTG